MRGYIMQTNIDFSTVVMVFGKSRIEMFRLHPDIVHKSFRCSVDESSSQSWPFSNAQSREMVIADGSSEWFIIGVTVPQFLVLDLYFCKNILRLFSIREILSRNHVCTRRSHCLKSKLIAMGFCLNWTYRSTDWDCSDTGVVLCHKSLYLPQFQNPGCAIPSCS